MGRPHSDLEQSNQIAIEMWKIFAQRARQGEIRDWSGVLTAFSKESMPFLNMAFFSKPPAAGEFEDRMRTVLDYANAAAVPWMFFVCDDWLPQNVAGAKDEVFAHFGLHPAITFIGMVTDQLTPAQSLPSLELRRVADDETRMAISDINCVSYDMPIESGRESIAEASLWRPEDFAYVGYIHGKAVSSAGVWIVNGIAYVAMVATLPGYRRKGYAEAIMRHSLEQTAKATGIRHTVLHATPAGFPIYQRMGYRAVGGFTCYVTAV